MIQRTNASINPWRLLEKAAEQLPAMATAPGWPDAAFPVDVIEADDHLLVKVSLPGVDANSIDLSLENNTLAFSAKLHDQAPEGGRYLYRERPVGQVRRAIALPVRLNPDQTQASLENGVLTVRVNKAAEATAKKITVQASGQPQAITG